MGSQERIVDRVAGGVLALKRAVVGLKRARDSEDTFRDVFYRFPRKSKPWTTRAADAIMNVFVETSPKGLPSTEEAKQRLQDVEAIVCSATVEPAVEEDDDATADDLNQEACHISPQQPTEGRTRLKRLSRAHQSCVVSKAPMPRETSLSSPAHFTAAVSPPNPTSAEAPFGNSTRDVRVPAENRHAAFAGSDVRREMHNMMEFIADESEPIAITVTGPLARKRRIVGSLKTYRCRAYPTSDQERVLMKFARAETLDAYNAAVQLMDAARRANAKQPKEITLKEKVRLQFDSAQVPTYMVDAGVRRAVTARERKRELAVSEGHCALEYMLHEYSETNAKTLSCTFSAQRKGIKHVRRSSDTSKTCFLNFDWRAHRHSAIRQVGTVKVKERALGDLEEHIRFNVYNSPEHLVQKEDVRFEFDKRRARWYACFLYDEATPSLNSK